MKGFIVFIKNKKHQIVAILHSSSKRKVEEYMVDYSMRYSNESYRAIIEDQRKYETGKNWSGTEYIKL